MKLLQICIYTLIVAMVLGCQTDITQERGDQQKAVGITGQSTDPQTKERRTGEEIAEHLVHLAERIPEVKSATALVLGDLVAIGIDVNDKLERSDVGVVKYEVVEALKDDPDGAYAFVSVDPDVTARLREMRKEIQAGHPVSGIMNELSAIVGRLIPIVPGPEHKKEEPKPTDANQEKLGKKQENKLEDIQEDQGKRDMDEE